LFEMGLQNFSAWSGLEPQLSWSLPPE
jgi:hypothetical protein